MGNLNESVQAETTETVAAVASAVSAPATGIFEKIKQSADSAFAGTVEILKRGRGRPPKSGKPKANDIFREIPADNPAKIPVDFSASNPAPAAAVSPAPAAPIFSPALLRKCLSGILKGVLSFPLAKLRTLAVRKGKSESDAAKIVSGCAPTDEELDALSEFAGILLEKYNVNTKFAPEFAAGAICAGIGLRFLAAFQQINAIPE